MSLKLTNLDFDKLGRELLLDITVKLDKWRKDKTCSPYQHEPMGILSGYIKNHLKAAQYELTKENDGPIP